MSPDYVGKFLLHPIFPVFHNITFNSNIKKQTVDFNNVTGRWLLENLNTQTLFIIDIYTNYTWKSIPYLNNSSSIGGTWNLHNSEHEIDLTSGIHLNGDYIWLWSQKLSMISQHRFNMLSDVLYIGKITHLTNEYYDSSDSPSSTNDEKIKIASKINGTIIYGFEEEPEISEKFRLTRWWNH